MGEGEQIARLRWRCRRGMRELDLLVSGWLERRYGDASTAQREAFERLLDAPDPLLLAWLTGRARPDEAALAELVDAIRDAA